MSHSSGPCGPLETLWGEETGVSWQVSWEEEEEEEEKKEEDEEEEEGSCPLGWVRTQRLLSGARSKLSITRSPLWSPHQ